MAHRGDALSLLGGGGGEQGTGAAEQDPLPPAFHHTIEEQIGGQLAAGFVLKDVYQDTNGYGKLEEYGVPTFWATKAVKPV